MNTDTGQIYDNLPKEDLKNLVEISEEDMTQKQRDNKQVSIHDNKSKLGKLYKECRTNGWAGLSKNQKRNLKKKLGLK